MELAKTLAIAFRVRQQMPGTIQSKFEYLVIDNVIAAGELELATKAARRKNKNVEDVLIEEFQVKPQAIGAALAKFFGVEYEPFKADRIKPPDLLKNIKRDYAEANHWIPLEDVKQGVIVMSTDPERVRNSRMVDNVFPRAKIVYKVSTERDFELTLDQFFGAEGAGGSESIGDLLSSLDEDEEGLGSGTDEVSAAADNELVKLVNKIIVDAYQQGASDIHIEPLPGKGKTGDPLPQGRHAHELHRGAGLVPQCRSPRASRSCATWTSRRSASRRTARSSSRSSARSTSSCGWRPFPRPAGSRTS